MTAKEMNKATQDLAEQITEVLEGQPEAIAIAALAFLSKLFVASSPNREKLAELWEAAALNGQKAGERITDRPVLH